MRKRDLEKRLKALLCSHDNNRWLLLVDAWAAGYDIQLVKREMSAHNRSLMRKHAAELREAQSAIPHTGLVYEARGAGLYKADRVQ